MNEVALSANQLNQISYDLPAVRKGYLQPVANFEFGETRSRYLGNGRVIALLPDSSKQGYQDYLAHIADEQRKNSGETPTSITAFQYQLNPRKMTAALALPTTVDARSLFTAKRVL